jgi:hypothetical protein
MLHLYILYIINGFLLSVFIWICFYLYNLNKKNKETIITLSKSIILISQSVSKNSQDMLINFENLSKVFESSMKDYRLFKKDMLDFAKLITDKICAKDRPAAAIDFTSKNKKGKLN